MSGFVCVELVVHFNRKDVVLRWRLTVPPATDDINLPNGSFLARLLKVLYKLYNWEHIPKTNHIVRPQHSTSGTDASILALAYIEKLETYPTHTFTLAIA